MRGTAFEDMGDDASAEKDFKKTIELDSSHFVAAYRLGMVYFRKKDFETAVKWLKTSLDNTSDVEMEGLGLGKNNILFVSKKVIAGNLGNFLTQIKRFEEGFKYLDEAIKIDPNYGNPYMAKGMALAQMGRPKDGIPFLKKAADLGLAQAVGAIKLLEQLANKQNQDTSDAPELELEFVFHSSDHIRYENGKHVSGPHGSAPRAIKVEANISGNPGYTVTLFNTDGGQAVVQMAPKQMKLISAKNEKIVLRGYGTDSFGASFADYGLTVFHDDGQITKCIMHMHDRKVDIEYMPK
jgi:tetratricopeptide (TPR) repeat protein